MPAIPPTSPPARADLLARAFLLSLAFHLLTYAAWRADQRLHLLDQIRLPAFLTRAREKIFPTLALTPPAPVAQSEPPLLFVEVNPAAAIAQPVKSAKYYSSQNSRAANPDSDLDTGVPKITGTQTHVVKTETVPRVKPAPTAATPAPAQPQPQTAAPKKIPGQTELAKPEAQLRPETLAPTPQPKPRTLAEAQARQSALNLTGEKMKQSGGVKTRTELTALDTLALPFGAYDAAIFAAISDRFHTLCDDQPLTRAQGRVVLDFHLNYDGRISDLVVREVTVTDLLSAIAQRAILDPAPYARWTDEMHREIGKNFREIRVTFYYE
ncbi:MAG: hypothetical protein RL380_1458 [Verrucomicrobiota bacterium]